MAAATDTLAGVFDVEFDPNWKVGKLVTTHDGRKFRITRVVAKGNSVSYYGVRS